MLCWPHEGRTGQARSSQPSASVEYVSARHRAWGRMYVKARPLGGENRCLLGHLAGGASGSHPQGLFTCHGCVAQEACDLLLTQLLLLVGQQLVEELPEDLLSRCVQNRVHVDDEGVDVPAGGWRCRSRELITQSVDEVVVPDPGIQLMPRPPPLKDRAERTGKQPPEAVGSGFKSQFGLGMLTHWWSAYRAYPRFWVHFPAAPSKKSNSQISALPFTN